MLLINASVGFSSLHGLGLIARHDIPMGTLVWRFESTFDRIIGLAQFASLSAAARRQVEHYGYLYGDAFYLSSDDDRFTNHSDTPNTTFVLGCAYASSHIKSGDEITADYSEFGASFEQRLRRLRV